MRMHMATSSALACWTERVGRQATSQLPPLPPVHMCMHMRMHMHMYMYMYMYMLYFVHEYIRYM